MLLIPALTRQRQMDHCDFEASIVYRSCDTMLLTKSTGVQKNIST